MKTLNCGGGARWFINEHVGVGFDLRWHNLSTVPATATHPGAPRTTLVTAGVGVVLNRAGGAGRVRWVEWDRCVGWASKIGDWLSGSNSVVESQLPKLLVAGSIPVSRSNLRSAMLYPLINPQHLVAAPLHDLRRQPLEVQPQQWLGVRRPNVEVPVGNSAEMPSSW